MSKALRDEVSKAEYLTLDAEKSFSRMTDQTALEMPPPGYKHPRPRSRYSIAESLGYRFYYVSEKSMEIACELTLDEVAEVKADGNG